MARPAMGKDIAIKRMKDLIDDKYEIDENTYIDNYHEMRFICPKHGEFWKKPRYILEGHLPCDACKHDNHRLSFEEFVKRANKVHNNKYTYLEEGYIGARGNITYICPIHGKHTQSASAHLAGEGCKLCGFKKSHEKFIKLTDDIFKNIEEKCKEKNCEFKGFVNDEWIGKYKTHLILHCPIHDYTWTSTTYISFVNHNNRCPKCSGVYSPTQEEAMECILEACKRKNLSFLGYTDEKGYNVANTKNIKIKCNKCGYEKDVSYYYLTKADRGCKQCRDNKMSEERRNDVDVVLKNIQDECAKRNYEFKGFVEGEYRNNSCHLILKCNNCGYDWKTTTVNKFLNRHQGCPQCNQSHIELTVSNLLKENGIEFEYNRYYEFLNNLQLDFYIPSKKIAIECQGGQHFNKVDLYGGEEGFKATLERDNLKRELCEKNNIKLLYFSNLGIEYPYKVFENTEELLLEILR